jgi:dihydrolipoamide dehydrogenase
MSNLDKGPFDLCIIGCGSAGFSAAMRALDLGKKVCIVESADIGGAGVKWGALASKTMYELSKDFAIASKTDRGYSSKGLVADYAAVRRTVMQAVREKQAQMAKQIEAVAANQTDSAGRVRFIQGRAGFLSPRRIRVTRSDGGRENIEADHVLIATGSKPRQLPGVSVDQKRIFDSDGILNLERFPKRLMIIGSGIVGCEYTTIFSNYRQTDIYLIDREERILPYEDPDVSDFIDASFTGKGVDILHSAELSGIDDRSDGLRVGLAFDDGHKETYEVDALLMAVGRTAQSADLGLAQAGIETNEWGIIQTDEFCCAGGSVYAAGDVSNYPNLVSIAELEGRQAVRHMFGLNPLPFNYDTMATVMFFSPPVAAVGLNEQQCQKKKLPYKVGVYSFALLNRAIAMRAPHGFVKIIVSDDDQKRILGMRSAGPQVSAMIMAVAFLIDQARPFTDLSGSIYPHPTMAEAIQECLRLLRGDCSYKPQVFPEYLNVRRWCSEKGYW